MPTTINHQRAALRRSMEHYEGGVNIPAPEFSEGLRLAATAIRHALEQKHPLVTLTDMVGDRQRALAGEDTLDAEWVTSRPGYDPDRDYEEAEYRPNRFEVQLLAAALADAENGCQQ